MEYLALIYGDGRRGRREQDDARRLRRYTRFSEDARAAGVLVGGAELASTTTATTVRVRDGKGSSAMARTAEASSRSRLLRARLPVIRRAVDWQPHSPRRRHGAVEVARSTSTRLPEMRYALLVYSDQSAWDALDLRGRPPARRSMPKWLELFDELGKADRTPRVASWTRVHAKSSALSAGERVVTDGPFAETKS